MHIVYVRTCSHTSSYSLVLSHFRGPIELKVGDGGSKNSTHSGGNVDISAGNAHGRSQTGGRVSISAGGGYHTYAGKGGSVTISAGASGSKAGTDHGALKLGGNLELFGGDAFEETAGDVLIRSGLSEKTSSGDIGK